MNVRRLASSRGQGLVEFAVIFPIFMSLIFLVFDGGIVMGRYAEMNNASKEGARLAATGVSETTIITRTRQHARGLVDTATTDCTAYNASTSAICVDWLDREDGDGIRNAGQVGSAVRVRVKYNYPMITPLINRVVNGIDVETCAIMRLEKPIPNPPETAGVDKTC